MTIPIESRQGGRLECLIRARWVLQQESHNRRLDLVCILEVMPNDSFTRENCKIEGLTTGAAPRYLLGFHWCIIL